MLTPEEIRKIAPIINDAFRSPAFVEALEAVAASEVREFQIGCAQMVRNGNTTGAINQAGQADGIQHILVVLKRIAADYRKTSG